MQEHSITQPLPESPIEEPRQIANEQPRQVAIERPRRSSGAKPAKRASSRGRRSSARPARGATRVEARRAQPLEEPAAAQNRAQPRALGAYLKLGGLAVLFGLLVLIAVIAIRHHPGEGRGKINEIAKQETAVSPETKDTKSAEENAPAASPKVNEADESASSDRERLVEVPLPRKPPSVRHGPPGIVKSRTGARAHVGVRYAARFQAYIDDLESNYGARVLFMGGIRRGHCSPRHEHPCGKALDVCQISRGVVDPRCKLPNRELLGRIAASHGLFEGGRWCDSDYGHAQVDVTAPSCDIRRARRQTNEVSARRTHMHRRSNDALAHRAGMSSATNAQW